MGRRPDGADGVKGRGHRAWAGGLLALFVLGAAACEDETRRPEVEREPEPTFAQPVGVPLSGGTLALSADGRRAVVADPGADVVRVVIFPELRVERRIELDEGAQPTRVVRGAGAFVHVVLRGTGQLLSLDLETGTDTLRDICPEPRGVASDATRLYVTCQGGQLLTLPEDPTDASPGTSVFVAPDLRDVVAGPDGVFLSRFRHAEVLRVEEGEITRYAVERTAVREPASENDTPPLYDARVAYRMILGPEGPLVVHQLNQVNSVAITGSQPYYDSGEPPVVTATSRPVTRNGEPRMETNVWGPRVLPVDVAVSSDGSRVAIAAAGSRRVIEHLTPFDAEAEPRIIDFKGMPVGVAYANDGRLVVATEQPAGLVVKVDGHTAGGTSWPSVTGPEWKLFHEASRANGTIACASCHPEAGEDGHVWSIDTTGPRRTQTLRGGVLQTQPLHWDGSLKNMDQLMRSTFESRMGGSPTSSADNERLGAWLDALPGFTPFHAQDDALVAEGRALFEDATVGCAGCHYGPMLTDDRNHDVGTGRPGAWRGFQTPSLVGVAQRAPYMHDGCASTLRARFSPRAKVIEEKGVRSCGGGDRHGVTSHLTSAQLDALVAYLETL